MAMGLKVVLAAALLMQTPAPPPSDNEVSGVVIKAAPKPQAVSEDEFKATEDTAWRAPHYSIEQIASMDCMAKAAPSRGGRRSSMRTVQRLQTDNQAMAMTVRYEQVAAAFRAGKATVKELQTAEFNRETAVAAIAPVIRAETLTGPTEGPFVIEHTGFRFAQQKDRLVMLVSGDLRNSGETPAKAPTFVASAVDRFDLVLAEETFDLGPTHKSVSLKPGESVPFQVVFPDAPSYTNKVLVHFGIARFERTMRCAAMDKLRSVDANNPFAKVNTKPPAPVGDHFVIANVKALPVTQGTDKALDISATVHNGSTDRRRMPEVTLVLKGAKGEVIGVAEIDLAAAELDGGATAPLEIQVTDIQWRKTAAGQASFADLKSVAFVVG